jgi:hypothetical protein
MNVKLVVAILLIPVECTEIDSLMSFLNGGCFLAILTP